MRSHPMLSTALLTCVLVIVACAFFVANRVSGEAHAALASSDKAFDGGNLKLSLVEARLAATIAPAQSSAQHAAIERLTAIAVGSEPAGRIKTALLAWMSLLTVPSSASTTLDMRLKQQAFQQANYLNSKTADYTPVDAQRTNSAFSLVSFESFSQSSLAVLLLFVAIVLGVALFAHDEKGMLGPLARWLVPLLALSSWCIGWLIT